MSSTYPTHIPEKLVERFRTLFTVISNPQFLSMQGIGNEVPFFIFAFEPADQNPVDVETANLIANLERKGIAVLEINLYDTVQEILQSRGLWDRLLSIESTVEKDTFKEQIQNLTDVETKLIPAIAEKITSGHPIQLLLITGVGLVYPFIRTHSLLNKLQSVAKDYPTLLFFPGRYTFTEGRGQSLDLFGALNEDKYYRAFNIDDYKL